MSNIKEIEINRQFTINLGNYESARFGVSMTTSVEPDDDPDEVYAELLDTIEKRLEEELEMFSKD
jgi:hypothetical protein